MKQILLLLTLLMTISASAQIADMSFENWQVDSAGHKFLSKWVHYSGNGPTPNTYYWGTWRADTAQQGIHALKLSRWYNYTCDWVQQSAAIATKPWGVSGYYKYEQTSLQGGNIDSAIIDMVLTKWNTATSKRDTVGRGKKMLLAIPTFTLFNCQVTYTSSLTPDTVTVSIRPMPWAAPHQNLSGLGSYLTIDDLLFQERTVSTSVQNAQKKAFEIYPNPVKDKMYIDVVEPSEVLVLDMTGKTILRNTISKTQGVIDMSSLQTGNYMLILNNNKQMQQAIKFVKE